MKQTCDFCRNDTFCTETDDWGRRVQAWKTEYFSNRSIEKCLSEIDDYLRQRLSNIVEYDKE